jgi:hypothetical protein
MVICCCFQTFKELLTLLFAPFLFGSANVGVFILSPKFIFFFYHFFPLKKAPFLIGSAKVRAESFPTKFNFSFDEIIFDFADIF